MYLNLSTCEALLSHSPFAYTKFKSIHPYTVDSMLNQRDAISTLIPPPPIFSNLSAITVETRIKEPAVKRTLKLKFHRLNPLIKNPKEAEMGIGEGKVNSFVFEYSQAF